jgi:hypothetical protein
MPVEPDYIARSVEILGILLADPSFWIGFVAVGGFSLGRFNERQHDDSEIDPPVLTRSYTTRFRYYLAAATYTATYWTIYLMLIVVGSIPFFQEYLIQLIGTIEGKDIGTPAWAAMVITAVVPAIPRLRGLDHWLRETLQEFASIPLKARRLAEEIVSGLISAGMDGADRYDELRDQINRLTTLPKLKKQQAYARFFAQYKSIRENLDRQREALLAMADSEDKAGRDSALWNGLADRLARLIACSVLHTESDEYAARRVLREDIGNRDVALPSWRFTNSQILVAAVTVVIAAAGGLVISSAYVSMTYFQTDGTTDLVLAVAGHAMFISVLAIPMFVLPLVYAAGVQMYLLDREELGDPLEWHEKLLAHVFTFGMCYGLALLPLMIVAAIGAHHWDGGSVNILIWAPWAVPPAAAATLFVITSTVKWTDSPGFNLAVDGALHAAVTFIISYAAMVMATSAGFKPDLTVGVPPGTIAAITPITMAFIGGAFGALQCNISRHGHTRMQRPAGPSQMVPARASGQH